MTLFLYRLQLSLHERSVRRDLSNAYEMHRSLSRAFVDASQEILRPFLWRLETMTADEPPIVLVQASTEAQWQALPTGWLIDWQERRWDPQAVLRKGQRVAFRMRANPTVNRVPQGEHTKGEGHSARGRRKRLGLWREGEQLEWLQRQAEKVGLEAIEVSVSQVERLRCRKAAATITMASVQFDGGAVVADPIALANGLCHGIGHGRMLGHGLLSLAPLRS
jgi:CRISPR system Cascade subunit CasE